MRCARSCACSRAPSAAHSRSSRPAVGCDRGCQAKLRKPLGRRAGAGDGGREGGRGGGLQVHLRVPIRVEENDAVCRREVDPCTHTDPAIRFSCAPKQSRPDDPFAFNCTAGASIQRPIDPAAAAETERRCGEEPQWPAGSPTPPARVEIRYANFDEFGALKSRMSSCRKQPLSKYSLASTERHRWESPRASSGPSSRPSGTTNTSDAAPPPPSRSRSPSRPASAETHGHGAPEAQAGAAARRAGPYRHELFEKVERLDRVGEDQHARPLRCHPKPDAIAVGPIGSPTVYARMPAP